MIVFVMGDPLRRFEHSHAAISKLALDIGELVRAAPAEGPLPTRSRRRLEEGLVKLRDELLRHFADEEEGLFPFIRDNVPSTSEVVEGLAGAHDAICGTVVRLVHLLEDEGASPQSTCSSLRALFARFEAAYAEHSRKEAALFEDLGRTLEKTHREELSEILLGL